MGGCHQEGAGGKRPLPSFLSERAKDLRPLRAPFLYRPVITRRQHTAGRKASSISRARPPRRPEETTDALTENPVSRTEITDRAIKSVSRCEICISRRELYVSHRDFYISRREIDFISSDRNFCRCVKDFCQYIHKPCRRTGKYCRRARIFHRRARSPCNRAPGRHLRRPELPQTAHTTRRKALGYLTRHPKTAKRTAAGTRRDTNASLRLDGHGRHTRCNHADCARPLRQGTKNPGKECVAPCRDNVFNEDRP